jgi:hypothetical protein
MGRKGNSKRKPSMKKATPLSSAPVSGSVSAVLHATENKPVKVLETTKPEAASRKKTPKKG